MTELKRRSAPEGADPSSHRLDTPTEVGTQASEVVKLTDNEGMIEHAPEGAL